jgi:hypothetical protein
MEKDDDDMMDVVYTPQLPDNNAYDSSLEDSSLSEREDAIPTADEMEERRNSYGVWHGGFPKGSIEERTRRDRHEYVLRMTYKAPSTQVGKSVVTKTFRRTFKDMNQAETFRRRLSIRLKRTRFPYRWVYPKSGQPRCGQIRLSDTDMMLFDEQDLPLIKQHKWFAVFLKRENGLVLETRLGPKRRRFDQMVMDTKRRVIHINGDSLDCRRCNLQLFNPNTDSDEDEGESSDKKKKPDEPAIDTSCDLVGVARYTRKNGSFWRSRWKMPGAAKISCECYSVKRYGEARAKELAIMHHLVMEETYKTQRRRPINEEGEEDDNEASADNASSDMEE